MNNIVVILNYNDYSNTNLLVNKIMNFKFIDKIIIVDNYSTDNSYEKLKLLDNEKIEVIRTLYNGGYAKGNNYGVYYALNKYNPRYFTIANPDVNFSDYTIEHILDFFNKCKNNIGIVSASCKTISDITIPYAWKLPSIRDDIILNFIILKKFIGGVNEYPKTHFEGKYSQVEVVSGAFFVISSEAFRKINGFDERTFLYGEENLLCYKLKKLGYRNYILNYLYYEHQHSASINKSIKDVGKRLDICYESRKVFQISINKINFFQKNVFKFTYFIGKYSYLLALKIFKIQR